MTSLTALAIVLTRAQGRGSLRARAKGNRVQRRIRMGTARQGCGLAVYYTQDFSEPSFQQVLHSMDRGLGRATRSGREVVSLRQSKKGETQALGRTIVFTCITWKEVFRKFGLEEGLLRGQLRDRQARFEMDDGIGLGNDTAETVERLPTEYYTLGSFCGET